MELARRGLRAVRYADDFVVFTGSRRAAERVQNGISLFLSEKLKLQVNREKTKIVPAVELEFLGLGFKDGIQLSAKKLDEFKGTFRMMTRKASLQSNPWDVQRLKWWLHGWFAHYGRIENKAQIIHIHQWVQELIRQRGQVTSELNVSLSHLWDLNVCNHGNWKVVNQACDRSERQRG
jgi:RNA-directed DNA polymerase